LCGDKDLALCLVRSDALCMQHASILMNRRKYAPILPSTVHSLGLGMQYAGVVRRVIEVIVGEGAVETLARKWESFFFHVIRPKSLQGLAASLQLTVKTHKPSGSVKVRAIHASSLFPFAPLGY
jgi:hypothetical protein